MAQDSIANVTAGTPSFVGKAISRRRLLLLAAAGTAGLAVGNAPGVRQLAGELEAGAGTVASGVRSLSVGFLKGSGDWPSLKLAPWQAESSTLSVQTLSAAGAAIPGDTVAMRVHGFTPGHVPAHFHAESTAILSVLFTAPDGVTHPFNAWQGRLSGLAASPPIHFPVPLDSAQGLELYLDILPPGGIGPAQRLGARIGAGPAAAPLQRGAYLLGLAPNQWRHSPTLATKGRASRQAAALAITFEPVTG